MRQARLPGIDWKKFADDLAKRKEMTASQRAADNARLKALRDSYVKMNRGKTVPCTPLVCVHCHVGLGSEKAMDDHRDETGHRRFVIELPDTEPSDAP